LWVTERRQFDTIQGGVSMWLQGIVIAD